MARIAHREGVPPDQCEDVAQEAWARAFARWEQFRDERSLDRLSAWLSVIAHHAAVDARRHNDKLPACSLDRLAAEPMDEQAAVHADTEEWTECLTVWLARLRRADPENCWLSCQRYLEGRTIPELADETGWTAHEISCRIWRTIQKLRSWMTELFPDSEDAS